MATRVIVVAESNTSYLYQTRASSKLEICFILIFQKYLFDSTCIHTGYNLLFYKVVFSRVGFLNFVQNIRKRNEYAALFVAKQGCFKRKPLSEFNILCILKVTILDIVKIYIFESCSWLGPLGVLIHQKKIFDHGTLGRAPS